MKNINIIMTKHFKLIRILTEDKKNDIIKLFFEKKYFNPYYTDHNKNSLLHYACFFNNFDLVQFLIKKYEMDVNKENINKNKPINLTDNNEIIKLLIDNDTDIFNGENCSINKWIYKNNYEMVNYVFEKFNDELENIIKKLNFEILINNNEIKMIKLIQEYIELPDFIYEDLNLWEKLIDNKQNETIYALLYLVDGNPQEVIYLFENAVKNRNNKIINFIQQDIYKYFEKNFNIYNCIYLKNFLDDIIERYTPRGTKRREYDDEKIDNLEKILKKQKI